MTISLAMIVKNEEAYLEACLKSVHPYVDEIVIVDTGSTDRTVEIAESFGAKVFHFDWIDDFAAARNFSFSKATSDWILWLDGDDVVRHPEKLRNVCEIADPRIDAIFLEYLYDVDKDGAIRTKHWRERLVRNNGALAWKGRLHETMIETRKANKVRNEELQIVHTATDERRDAAVARNVRILEKQLEDEKDKADPRTFFYLAACYRDLGDNRGAMELYEAYLRMSGWDEERCQAWCQIARIQREDGKDNQALQSYLQAIKERPDMPEPYIGIGELYCALQRFDRALLWLEMALAKKEPEYTSSILNPLQTTWRPLVLYAECKFQLGQVDEAISALKKAQQFKNDEFTQEVLKTYMGVKGHRLASEAFTSLALYLEKNGEEDKIASLVAATPADLLDNPKVLALKRRYSEPKVWPKRSAVIFTGASALGEWGPWSLKDGIGGSEEAIVRLSRRLVEQGYQVTVYAAPGPQTGLYEGVEWRNHWELDLNDTFDIFVSWRSPWFADATIKCRKHFVWMHDAMNPAEFTEERLANIDKVIVLSQFHRKFYANVPDDKIFVSANGIDPDEFVGKPKRNKYKIIYQSAHERGLSYLYDIWPSIKSRVPRAELHVMYGWDSFLSVNRDNPERMAWMEEMQARGEMLEGVILHGKVSHEDVVKHTLTANVWAYPTTFPEISCITAMKAQAGGAWPVVNNFAALKETVLYGDRADFTEWTNETAKEYEDLLVQAMTTAHPTRPMMVAAARAAFSWSNVAKGWIEEFES